MTCGTPGCCQFHDLVNGFWDLITNANNQNMKTSEVIAAVALVAAGLTEATRRANPTTNLNTLQASFVKMYKNSVVAIPKEGH